MQTSRALEQDEKNQNAKARFLGEFRQRVAEETQSPRKGRMRERTVVDGQDQEDELGLDGTLTQKRRARIRALFESASPNALPDDIKRGGETILNADGILYASFINRVADEIYDTWVEKIRLAMEKMSKSAKKLETNLYTTRLEVMLDSNGAVLGIKTLSGCGIVSIDEAPKLAFWENSPFPNPPSQLVGAEGVARFRYEFQFDWKQSGFSIVPQLL